MLATSQTDLITFPNDAFINSSVQIGETTKWLPKSSMSSLKPKLNESNVHLISHLSLYVISTSSTGFQLILIAVALIKLIF